jgi:membrane protease YdiL (CAAX protease family)
VFVGLSHAVRWFPSSAPRLLMIGLFALTSLSVLVWPWLRGVSWTRLRSDVGLFAGRRPGWELLVGLGCYVAATPLLVVGLLLTLALRTLGERVFGPVGPFSPEQAPTHPALDWVVNGDWSVRLQTLFVAAVTAPIVEEVFFRGVLYRHLRESTAGWGRIGSVVVSALGMSFLFAVIHPQGILGTPPLMALALAFALAREWRGTLLPTIVAHALNNGAITLALLAAVG